MCQWCDCAPVCLCFLLCVQPEAFLCCCNNHRRCIMNGEADHLQCRRRSLGANMRRGHSTECTQTREMRIKCIKRVVHSPRGCSNVGSGTCESLCPPTLPETRFSVGKKKKKKKGCWCSVWIVDSR